ncbi:DUF3137 domain-containing protein [Candidatus Izemoplasma sp. B36]|uniref:DUF3137 domain-containing protein n=1 Tax=Candidatus Izemoplasma sp. B36 TaxID=3242468 RepID=UPI0035583A81
MDNKMEELNKSKKIYDNLRITGIIISILGVILAFVLIRPTEKALIYLSFFIGVGPGLLVFLYAKSEVKKISNQFKLMYVKTEIEKRIPGSTFSPTTGIDQEIVKNSKLITLHEIYKTEDLIEGKINDVDFRCADVLVRDVRRSGKHTTVVTTFQGRFYEFDFPKTFKSNVFLLQPGQFRPFSGMKKMKMESIEFNSEFKIYTNDDHDTFYILTPQLMEKLLVLDNKYQDKIGFSFLNSKLFIAIDSRVDTFDVMGYGDITNKDVDKSVEEIENLIEFVEYLQLDDTLFKK